MNVEKPPASLACWDCGAPNDPGASECWLCQRRDWRDFSGTLATKPVIQPPEPSLVGPSAGSIVLSLLVAVVIVSFQSAPGLSIMLLISVLPAMIVTEIRASRRRHRGLPMSGIEKTLWVVGLTVLIPMLLTVALAIGLFAFCALSAH